MARLVGVAIVVARRLHVGVAELVVHEEDRHPGGEPQGRGGVAELVDAHVRR